MNTRQQQKRLWIMISCAFLVSFALLFDVTRRPLRTPEDLECSRETTRKRGCIQQEEHVMLLQLKLERDRKQVVLFFFCVVVVVSVFAKEQEEEDAEEGF